MRGVFPILATPFTDDGAVDEKSLKRLVDFCIGCGVHGLGEFGLASEFYKLTEDERRLITDLVIEQVGGRVPVVIGIGGPTNRVAVAFSRYAEQAGADAVLALPPYVVPASSDELMGYYRDISAAISLPIMIQDAAAAVPTAIPVDLIVKMAEGMENIKYVKEEIVPPGHKISRIIEAAGDKLSVFAGNGNLYVIDALSRGAVGLMPGCDVPDLHVGIYEAFQKGNVEQARERYEKVLPLLVFESQFFLAGTKAVLKRRGVIASAHVRPPAGGGLDEEDEKELSMILRRLGIGESVKRDA
jgi:4-hydroxy-tetrahydrodipicolinate synthase